MLYRSQGPIPQLSCKSGRKAGVYPEHSTYQEKGLMAPAWLHLRFNVGLFGGFNTDFPESVVRGLTMEVVVAS